MSISPETRKRILRTYNLVMASVATIVTTLAQDPSNLVVLGKWGGPATLAVVILNAAMLGWANKRREGE